MLQKIVLGFALAGLFALIWAALIEPRLLRVTRAELAVKGLTAPLKAVIVADTQSLVGHWSFERLRDRLAPLVEAQKPDIVFLLGDYAGVSHGPFRKLYNEWLHVEPQAASRLLGGLKAPMGVYAVLGNHDWAHDGEAVAAALAAGGATVLRNGAVEARTPSGDILTIAGVDDAIGPQGAAPLLALTETDPRLPLIFLTHRPDEVMRLPRAADLSLAGHTHGGQICLPAIGCPVSMSRHGFLRGMFMTPKGPLFVSSGVGTAAFPMRLMNPPEIVVVDLLPAEAPARAGTPEALAEPESELVLAE